MAVRTRYAVDLAHEHREFWKELISLEAFVGVVISPTKNAATADELFKLVHFIYWLAPANGISFQDGVRQLRNDIALLPRDRRRSLQKTARAKLMGLNRFQIRALLYGKQASKGDGQKADFYKSWEWRTLRMKILKERGPRCECCGASPDHHDSRGNPIRICVDHIKPIAGYWRLRLDPSNLQVLCDECNQGKGAWDETDWRAG